MFAMKRRGNGSLAIGIVSALLVFQQPGSGKPMRAATLDEAVLSPSIVVARYIGYRTQEKPAYFNPPIAKYEVVRSLKGSLPARPLEVRYEFHDGSACLEMEGWQFSEQLMPAKQSEWILFLQPQSDGIYLTYRGDFGRMKATAARAKEIEALLAKPAQPRH